MSLLPERSRYTRAEREEISVGIGPEMAFPLRFKRFRLGKEEKENWISVPNKRRFVRDILVTCPLALLHVTPDQPVHGFIVVALGLGSMNDSLVLETLLHEKRSDSESILAFSRLAFHLRRARASS